MRIESCSIDNFRALRKLELKFAAETTVLIGENGCGKSSVLYALNICLGRSAPAGSFDIAASDFHRFHPPDNSAAERMKIAIFFRGDADDASRWPLFAQAGLLDKQGEVDFCLWVAASQASNEERPLIEFGVDGLAGPSLISAVELLAEVRRIMPFLMIRGVWAPVEPLGSVESRDKAREEVEGCLRGVLADLADVEQLALTSGGLVDKAIEEMMQRLQRQGKLLKPGEDRSLVMAPMSGFSSWEQVADIMKGSGARSLAMLAFVEAFLKARGDLLLDSDACPVVAIEDPEARLHPLLLTSIWDLVQRLPAQRLVTSNSADLLAAAPLDALRRMVRDAGGRSKVYAALSSQMTSVDLRRVAYHLRVRRGTALFMRFWILVEGETEFWLMSEAARALGIDLRQEGIECIEFAQSGLTSLVTLANHLGIGWHLLADGDKSGQHYYQQAIALAEPSSGSVTILKFPDIEQCLWHAGYARIYQLAAGGGTSARHRKPRDIIAAAVRQLSKPELALMLGEAMRVPGSPGVPAPIDMILKSSVEWSRSHGP